MYKQNHMVDSVQYPHHIIGLYKPHCCINLEHKKQILVKPLFLQDVDKWLRIRLLCQLMTIDKMIHVTAHPLVMDLLWQ